MRTFRRLNDPERYYGLSWRGWLAAGAGGGILYLAVRVSPLGLRPTITIVVLALAFVGVILHGLSGQAIGPARYLAGAGALPAGVKDADASPSGRTSSGSCSTALPNGSAEPADREPESAARARGAAGVSRTARTGSLGELLPLAAVEPDGLLVTTGGRYVRLIECQRVPNTITADESRLQILERAFRELCRAIPDRQSLVIYAQTDPIPIDEALGRGPRTRPGRVRAGHRRRQRRARRDAPAVPRRADADRRRRRGRGAARRRRALVGRRPLPARPLPKRPASSSGTLANRARGRTALRGPPAPRRSGACS